MNTNVFHFKVQLVLPLPGIEEDLSSARQLGYHLTSLGCVLFQSSVI